MTDTPTSPAPTGPAPSKRTTPPGTKPPKRRNYRVAPAAMRRGLTPITFTFEAGAEEEGGEAEEITVTVDPTLDLPRFAVLLGEFAAAADKLTSLEKIKPEDMGDIELGSMLKDLAKLVDAGREAFTQCMVESDRERFADEIAPLLQLVDMMGMVRDIMTELAGMDPTSQPDSSQ